MLLVGDRVRAWLVKLLVLLSAGWCVACGAAMQEDAGYAAQAPTHESAARGWDNQADDSLGEAAFEGEAPPPPPEPPMLSAGGKGKGLPPVDSGLESGTVEPKEAADPKESAVPEDGSGPSEPKKVTKPQRYLIYTATLVLAVFETTKSIDAVEKLALDLGGYLVRRGDLEITVRVPAERFRGALEDIAKTGDELHRDVQVQDVSDQYRDLLIRLRNAEATHARLVKLLDDANTVKDALAVEAQLERLAGDIELLKGRLKRLSELVAFSTITVRYEAEPADEVGSKFSLPFPWLDRLGLPNLMEMY